MAAAAGGGGAPSLQHLCMAAAEDLLGVGTVCAILGLADLVRPSADQLRAAAVAWLAAHLPAVLAAHPAGLQQLSFDCMLELLQHASLVSSLPGSTAAGCPLTTSAAVAKPSHQTMWPRVPTCEATSQSYVVSVVRHSSGVLSRPCPLCRSAKRCMSSKQLPHGLPATATASGPVTMPLAAAATPQLGARQQAAVQAAVLMKQLTATASMATARASAQA